MNAGGWVMAVMVLLLAVAIPVACIHDRKLAREHPQPQPLFVYGDRVQSVLDGRVGVVLERVDGVLRREHHYLNGFEYRVRLVREPSNVALNVAVGGAGLIGGGSAGTSGASPYVIVHFLECELKGVTDVEADQ